MYEANFIIKNEVYEQYIQTDCLEDIKDGFWITNDYKFTKGSDSYMFILPHQIKYIIKINTISYEDIK